MARIDGTGEDMRFSRHLVDIIRKALASQGCCSGASARAAFAEMVARRPDGLRLDIHRLDESGIDCAVRLLEAAPDRSVFMLFVGQNTMPVEAADSARQRGVRKVFGGIHGEGSRPGDSVHLGKKTGVKSGKVRPALGVGRLSTREREILARLAEGCSNQEISARLDIATGTVRTHLMHIYKKLRVNTRTRAAAKFLGSTPTDRVARPAVSLPRPGPAAPKPKTGSEAAALHREKNPFLLENNPFPKSTGLLKFQRNQNRKNQALQNL